MLEEKGPRLSFCPRAAGVAGVAAAQTAWFKM